MIVNKLNFNEVIEEVEEDLATCSFACIDVMSSGLNKIDITWDRFNTLQERYDIIREGCIEKSIIEIGLSIFKITDSKRWTQKTYNFSISNYSDFNIFDVSDTKLLTQKGFDFKEWFDNALLYLKPSDVEKHIEKIQSKYEYKEDPMDEEEREPIEIPEENQEFVERQCSKIGEFVNGDDDEVELEQCNSFIRLLLYQEIGSRYPEVSLRTKTSETGDKIMFASRDSMEQMKAKREEEKQRKIEQVKDSLRFIRVIDAIGQSGKLLIGHDMFLAFCHIVEELICDLPEDIQDFVSLISSKFPSVLDVKYLASSPALRRLTRDSSLNGLVKRMKDSPFMIPDVEGLIQDDTRRGFYSYTTGICFISLLSHLNNDSTFSIDILHPYTNKLPLLRLEGFSHIDLKSDKQLSPSRSNLIHVKCSSMLDVPPLFSEYGSVVVSSIDDKNCWVILVGADEEKVSEMVPRFYGNPNVTVTSYKLYKQQQATSERLVRQRYDKEKRFNCLDRVSVNWDLATHSKDIYGDKMDLNTGNNHHAGCT